MVITLTLNPSLDYSCVPLSFVRGITNRTVSENIEPGGKGINVSLTLKKLGEESLPVALVAGHTGNIFTELLKERGLEGRYITLPEGFTRINVKLKENRTTEFNASGIRLDSEAVTRLLEILHTLKKGDILVVSGSLPQGVEKDFYKRCLEEIEEGVSVVADTSGEALLKLLPLKPLLIKPNEEEIKEIADLLGIETEASASDSAAFEDKKKTENPSAEDDSAAVNEKVTVYESHNTPIIDATVRKMQSLGAENVIVSLGASGALLFTKDGETVYESSRAKTVVNTVGAGDAFVAGFIYEYERSRDAKKAFLKGSETAGERVEGKI